MNGLGTPELDAEQALIDALDDVPTDDEPEAVREAMNVAFDEDAKREAWPGGHMPASLRPMPSLEEELFGRRYEEEAEVA